MKKNQNYGQATRFDFNNQLQQQQKNIKPKRKIILQMIVIIRNI
jgi:hypothetical protein